MGKEMKKTVTDRISELETGTETRGGVDAECETGIRIKSMAGMKWGMDSGPGSETESGQDDPVEKIR
ncbi:hypothetical protein EVAR_98886_1 [Eumeta japonica]|uniref:Uncharacterized protein n=1 Tax=Eumeta variegata TaxID=151549 RepID=A0A4C2A5A4_EUMVA|nr:hypothetical protein EVAR_98886_1 [Eumeta japonica]